jgi:hypothetical protein
MMDHAMDWCSKRAAVLFALLAVAASLVPMAAARSRAAAPPARPTLYVNYTTTCTFSIVDDAGHPVTSIPPGSYQIMVTTPIMFKLLVPGGPSDPPPPGDFSGCRGWVQFSLTGPGVNASTTLDFGCDSALLLPPVTFSPSATYTAVDQNQPSVAHASFTTLAGGTPPTPTTSPYDATSGKGDVQQGLLASGSALGTLNGKVNPVGRAVLLNHGSAVKSLPSGKYHLTILDEDTKAGFSILGPKSTKVSVLTSPGYVGRRTVTVNLTAGRWIFYSNVGKQSAFVVTG